MKKIIKFNRRALENANILSNFYENPEQLDQATGDSIFRLTWILGGNLFEPKKGVINSLIFSGQINSIKNKELKYKIASLNDEAVRLLEYTKTVNSNGKQYFDRIIYPKICSTIEDGKTITVNPKEMFKIPEFYIAVLGNYGERRKGSIRNEEELKELYEEVLMLIDSEIDSE